jgi:anti-sigma-K factor RskA
MSPEERQIQAGEYVLGTLPADERAAVERALTVDDNLRAAVRAWEERLAPLAARLPDRAPPAHVWTALERALGSAPGRSGAGEVVPFANRTAIDALRRSRAIWRGVAATATALAAGLALFIAVDRFAPAVGDRDEYVAVVNRGGDLPALIVRVDTREGVVRVRPLAAETPSGRSLELWYIGADRQARSLGTLDDPNRAITLPAVAQRAGPVEGATLAVTVEPPGGSPTGTATGPIVYSGRLVRE